MANISQLLEILKDDKNISGTELLAPVMKQGVESNVFPRVVPSEDVYMDNWNAAREMMIVFLENAEKY
jgi:hypothetical protein